MQVPAGVTAAPEHLLPPLDSLSPAPMSIQEGLPQGPCVGPFPRQGRSHRDNPNVSAALTGASRGQASFVTTIPV